MKLEHPTTGTRLNACSRAANREPFPSQPSLELGSGSTNSNEGAEMDIDTRAVNAADEVLAGFGLDHSKSDGGVADYIDLALTDMREGVHRRQARFTLERGTHGEKMRRQALHAALDILLDEDDPLMRLAMMKAPSDKA